MRKCVHRVLLLFSTTKVTCYLWSVSSWLLSLITSIFWKSLCNRSRRPLYCFHGCMILCVKGRYPSFIDSYKRALSCSHFFSFYFIFINNNIVILSSFHCIEFHFLWKCTLVFCVHGFIQLLGIPRLYGFSNRNLFFQSFGKESRAAARCWWRLAYLLSLQMAVSPCVFSWPL